MLLLIFLNCIYTYTVINYSIHNSQLEDTLKNLTNVSIIYIYIYILRIIIYAIIFLRYPLIDYYVYYN